MFLISPAEVKNCINCKYLNTTNKNDHEKIIGIKQLEDKKKLDQL